MAKKVKIRALSTEELRRKYKKSDTLSIALTPENKLWLPSRVLHFNYQLGGGIPYGRILELFGYESTGKSLLALDFASVTQSLGGKVLWGDIEFIYESTWAKQNGVDSDKIELFEDNSIEKFSDWALDMMLHWRSKLTKNEPILLVCDSIAALECEENIGTSQLASKAEMGNRAKAIDKFLRFRNKFFKELGVCVICVNQVREKVGASMFEDSQTTPGGKALRFYASQRTALIRSKQIKGYVNSKGFKEDLTKGKKVGQNIIIQVKKNKVAPPRDNFRTKVYFSDIVTGYVGYDRYAGLPDIFLNEKIIRKKGNGYKYKGNLIAKSEDELLKVLHTQEKLRSKLIRKSSINTISKTRARLANIKINLFPIKAAKINEEK